MRAVLSASFDLVGITSLRNDPIYSQIDGQAPDGRKIGVAILDTGVYANHPDLRSNFVAYYDAVNKTAATTNPSAAQDVMGHGTHVSGTVASSNPNYGVATRAGLIDVRVFPGPNERPPQHDAIVEGLRWVSQVYQQYNIKVVNMSLGFGNYDSSAAPIGSQAIAAAIRELERLGITVVASSGNDWADLQTQGSGFPANVSTVTVGNTWGFSFDVGPDFRRGLFFGDPKHDTFGPAEFRAVPDQLSGMTQRSASLPNQVMAPGMLIESTSFQGGTTKLSGTSMASPLVAGVVALLQDTAQTFGGRWLSPTEMLGILRDTAERIVDGSTDGNARVAVSNFSKVTSGTLSASDLLPLAETNQTYLRINAYRAVQAVRSLLGGGSAPVTGQDLNGTMSTAVTVPDLDGTRVFRALGSIGSDGNTSVGANDVDVVKIQLKSPGSISIRVDPDPNGRSFDPYLRLFDASGQELAAADDTNGNYPVLQSVTLPAGTYYAGVSSYANTTYGVSSATGRTGGGSQGEYVFTVTLENPDPNGVIAGAVPANEWASIPGGTLGYRWAYGQIGSDPPPVDGSPRVPVGLGDVDMFEVVAPDTGWLNIAVYSQQGLVFPSPNPFDALLRVFDENGALLTWADNNFNGTDPFVQMWVSRGQRLFVGVSAAFNASYSATSPYGRPQVAGTGSYEIAHWFDTGDANGSAWAAVDAAVLGSTIQGEIGRDFGNLVGLDGTKDVDFVSYTAQQTGMLDVTVAGQSGFVPAVTLWKWDPNQKNVVRLAERVDTSVNHRVAVQAGDVYYVSVTGAGNMGYQWFGTASGTGGMTGFYTITGSIQATSAVWQTQDDTFQGVAIPSLAGNDVRFGDLGLDGTLYRGATDVDLYRFQPQASGSVAFSAHGDGEFGASPVLRLFDAWGNELAFSQSSIDGRNGSTLEYDVVGGQTYYVGVSGWAESGDMRGYQPNGTLSTVSASTGSYVLSTSSNTTAGPSLDTVYVNQFGDAVLDGLVLGSSGLQFPRSLTWHDSGSTTIWTTGPLNTLLAWDSPQGLVTDSTLGGAVISRPVTAWEDQQVSVAGRDATSFGLTGVTVDGPSYQGVETIAISGGSGSTSGSITSAGGYSFYRFTAPASGRVRVAVAGRETDFHPTMVIFDGTGTPIGGSFLSALGDDLRGSAVRQVDWSGGVDAGQDYFVRVDGAGTDTGTYDLSITSGGSEFRVTTGSDSGIGSLRWAIDQANLSADPSTIWFDVSAGSGVALTTSLPAVTFDTAFRFAAGVSGFTIDASGLSAGAGPVLSVSGYGLTVSRTFASVDFSEAPISIVGFPDVGLALPDDLFNANVSGLTLVGRDVTSSIGISIGDSSGGRYPGTWIFGNTISGAHVGIAAMNATELRIEGNTVSGCRSSGIILSGRSDHTSIVGNVVAKNGTGLAGFSASGAVVGGDVGQGNQFEDNVQSGIYLAGASSGTGVFGNTFLRNNVGVTLDRAQGGLVGGLPAVQGNTVTADGNTALGQYRAGMYGVGDLRGSIALNTTINTPFLGLNLAQATGLTVVNTLVRNHSGLGLVAQGQGVGMTGTVISGLTVERSGSLPSIDTAGVVLIDATGMTLESGNFSGDTTALFVFNDATGLVVADNVFAGRTTGVGLFQARNLAFGQIGRGNTIQNAAGAGLYTGGNLAGTSVVANRINGCPVGIVLDNTTNLTIGGVTEAHGNTITGTGNSTGIWARLACTGTSIRTTKFSSHAANTALGAATGINFQP